MHCSAVTRYRRFAFIFLICIAGCSGLNYSRKPIHPGHPESLLKQVHTHASRLRTFQGRGRINIVSVEGGFRGTILIQGKTPDSLWVKVEGPFGVDVLSGVITDRSIALFYPREGLVYTGNADGMWEREMLPIPVGTYALVLSLVGLLVPEKSWTDRSVAGISEDGERILRFETGENYWIESEGPVVTRAELRDDEDRRVWEWEAKKFRKRRGVRLPLIIRMTQVEPPRRVTLFFESIRVNNRLRAGWCGFRIPEGVETIAF